MEKNDIILLITSIERWTKILYVICSQSKHSDKWGEIGQFPTTMVVAMSGNLRWLLIREKQKEIICKIIYRYMEKKKYTPPTFFLVSRSNGRVEVTLVPVFMLTSQPKEAAQREAFTRAAAALSLKTSPPLLIPNPSRHLLCALWGEIQQNVRILFKSFR